MKTRVFASLFVLSLMCLTLSQVRAQSGAAKGSYKFIMEDELSKYIEFDARSDERSNTVGYMQFTDQARVLFQDVDGTGEKSSDEPVEFYMAADIDGLVIEKNR